MVANDFPMHSIRCGVDARLELERRRHCLVSSQCSRPCLYSAYNIYLVYLIPPLAMLLLAQWGAPLSTSFLVLSKFEFKNSSSLIQISLFGYLIAVLYRFFSTGLGSGSSSDGFLIRINQIIRWAQFGLLRSG